MQTNYDVRLVTSTGTTQTLNLLEMGFPNPNHVTLKELLEKHSMSGFDRSKRYTISNASRTVEGNADSIVRGGDTVQIVKSHDNGSKTSN